MAVTAALGNCTVIEVGRRPGQHGVTIVTACPGGNVIDVFASRSAAIVAADAAALYFSVVYPGSGGPGHGVVAAVTATSAGDVGE